MDGGYEGTNHHAYSQRMPISRLSAETALGAGARAAVRALLRNRRPLRRDAGLGLQRLVGMADNANLPSVEHVKELGRQGLLWITTFTAESAKHKQ